MSIATQFKTENSFKYCSTSASRESVRLDYAPFLLHNIVQPLIDDHNEGVEESIHVMKEYRLLREDLDSLVELTTWPGKKSLMDSVDGRVKAALTRTYNKEVAPYTYSVTTATKKKRAAAGDDDYLNELDEDGGTAQVSDDDEDDDNVDNDTLIKAKKPTASSKASGSGSKGKAGTSGSSRAGTSKKAASSKKK